MSARKASYPSKAAIIRSIAAAKAAGINIGAVEVNPGGSIRVLAAPPDGGPVEGPDAAFDRWIAATSRTG